MSAQFGDTYNEFDYESSVFEYIKNNSITKNLFEQFNAEEQVHIIRVGASILMTKHGYRQGGGFVQTVIANDLHGAFTRADSTMLRAMQIMVTINSYCQVKKFTPEFETMK